MTDIKEVEVLLVEDNPNDQELTLRALQKKNISNRIHVASDGVELRSNGSRLAADMEVLVAVHYIRNLRQEALKGIHCRLQQGILPNAAPVGYLDCGAGKPKALSTQPLFERPNLSLAKLDDD